MLYLKIHHQIKRSCRFSPIFSSRSFIALYFTLWASLVAQFVENLSAVQGTWVLSLDQEIPWIRSRQTTLVSLSGKSLEQRNLGGGCNPWGRKESGMTEWLTLYVFYIIFMVHFELILGNMWDLHVGSYFCIRASNYFNTICWKDHHISTEMPLNFCQKSVNYICVGLLLTFLVCTF